MSCVDQPVHPLDVCCTVQGLRFHPTSFGCRFLPSWLSQLLPSSHSLTANPSSIQLSISHHHHHPFFLSSISLSISLSISHPSHFSLLTLTDLITAFCAVKHPSKPAFLFLPDRPLSARVFAASGCSPLPDIPCHAVVLIQRIGAVRISSWFFCSAEEIGF